MHRTNRVHCLYDAFSFQVPDHPAGNDPRPTIYEGTVTPGDKPYALWGSTQNHLTPELLLKRNGVFGGDRPSMAGTGQFHS